MNEIENTVRSLSSQLSSPENVRTFVTHYSVSQSWASDYFIASRPRQRDNVIEPQGLEQIQKIFRSRCD